MNARKEMSARERLAVMVRTNRGNMTVWSPAEVRDALDAHQGEVLSEAADLVDAMLTEEPDNARATALYEVLLRLRAKQQCTCARSQGLHEQTCRKYVPGHELISPVRALAAYRSEARER